ncbi:hypothetical protein AGMMS49940_11370 [Spirochaetia bacterium]|nr:hypothetical protein AGMMS49940_11370 [Spirochaetia bacterium]
MTLAVIFSAASLLICGFTFIYLQAYLRRRTGAERILADFEEEVNKIIAGIDAATDRDLTLLEDKAKATKALLETLDRRIAAYARELDRRNTQESARNALGSDAARNTEGAYTALGRGLRSTLRVNPSETVDAPAQTPPAMPEAATMPLAAQFPVPDGQSAEPRFIRSANPVKTRTPLTEQVLELSRNGFSPDTIATRLGVTLAEVDLALAMPEHEKPY